MREVLLALVVARDRSIGGCFIDCKMGCKTGCEVRDRARDLLVLAAGQRAHRESDSAHNNDNDLHDCLSLLVPRFVVWVEITGAMD